MKAIFSKRLAISLIITAAVAIPVGFKLHDNKPDTVKLISTTTETKPVATKTTPTAEPATTTTTEPVAPSTSTAPASSTTQDTVAPSKTVDELKAEASQRILGQGLVEQNVDCFYKTIDKLYGWNITESEMLHRMDNIEQMYYSYCTAWNVAKLYPPNPSEMPPGFRD